MRNGQMILNTGSRTDIPAYYSEWFYNRVKEGYVLVRNPYYPVQVTRYRLDPQVVDVLVFCTKNPAPMLPRLEEIHAFHQFWFVTITPYGREIEPYVPAKEQVMESFLELSGRVGVDAVGWRYDPIFLSEKYSVPYHIETFGKMADKLAGSTHQCVVSFIDLYEKTMRNFPGVSAVPKDKQEQLIREFVKIGKAHDITIYTCAEQPGLAECGAEVSGCMTQTVLERAIGCTLDIPASKNRARASCDCLLGSDIGMYNTCGHGCLYCYANYDRKTVEQNRKEHDPASPFLIGEGRREDIVKEAKQTSYLDGQMRLLF
jgi:hypothetical protein